MLKNGDKAKLEMDAVILAGGLSSRMGGEDKAGIKLGEKQMIRHVAETAKRFFKKIIIVSNTGAEYDVEDAVYTKDEVPYLGPLGGILAGLKSSSTDYSFITACDMPFTDCSLISGMSESVSGENHYDVIVPTYKGKVEPLFGFYSKSCIPYIEDMLKRDIRKVVSFYPSVKTLIVKANSAEPFFNVNDLKELDKARSRLEETEETVI